MDQQLLSYVIGGAYGLFLCVQYLVFYIVLRLRKEKGQLKRDLIYISVIAVSVLLFSVFGEISAVLSEPYRRTFFVQLRFLIGLISLNAFVLLLRYHLVAIKDMTFVETDSYKENTRKYLNGIEVAAVLIGIFLVVSVALSFLNLGLVRASRILMLIFLLGLVISEPVEFLHILKKERGKLNHFSRLRLLTILGAGEIAFVSLILELLLALIDPLQQKASAFMYGSIALSVGLSLNLIFEHMELLSSVNESNRKLNELNQRIMDDVRTAQSLQMSLLPVEKHHDIRKVLDLEVSYMPMQSVGGDYYDFYLLKDQKVLILLGDASGHGVYAAMIWAMLKVEVEELIEEGAFEQLGEAFNLLNKRITRILENTYSYATLFSCIVDIKDHKVSYLTAGHTDQLYFNSSAKQVNRIRNKNPIVGAFNNTVFHYDTISGSTGDVILLFTDGLTEAQNLQGDQLGIVRLTDIFERVCLKDRSQAISVLTSLLSEVEEFTEALVQQDDRTIIVIRL